MQRGAHAAQRRGQGPIDLCAFAVTDTDTACRFAQLWKDPFHTLIGFSMPSLLLLFVASYAVLFATFTLLFFYIEVRRHALRASRPPWCSAAARRLT